MGISALNPTLLYVKYDLSTLIKRESGFADSVSIVEMRRHPWLLTGKPPDRRHAAPGAHRKCVSQEFHRALCQDKGSPGTGEVVWHWAVVG